MSLFNVSNLPDFILAFLESLLALPALLLAFLANFLLPGSSLNLSAAVELSLADLCA